jgi:F420-non-reducing hydrogenase iron-sulfur subunit
VITETLEDMGYEPERFQLAWVSSAEPERLVEAFRSMAARLAVLRGEVPVDAETGE